ncbi:LOW QUALITY PROTEIN: Crinkler (CRN) family protein [Phytophthora palmivora]|uniref:Crinkler (CRN) family protein n=1 Tax=Phytophthora palmivora TaxID=4796 RepID=A0A2P4XZA2_9STRA|nr:LOW QUALITY PROTEIN: Crinkler (CRN) family protein [Phytophthora palmivora]
MNKFKPINVLSRTVLFNNLSVSEDEFRLDSLSTMQQSDRPIVMAPGLHEFWNEIGEFPPVLFRSDGMVFWEVVKRPLFGKARVVIVGSPGVGKSCFLMLIMFYLACMEKKKVLVIHRLKERRQKNAVILFDGQGSTTEFSPNDILAIRGQAKDAIVLNGRREERIRALNFLVTSCQYGAKHDDSSPIVVLPA